MVKYYTCKRCGLQNIAIDKDADRREYTRGSCCLLIIIAAIGFTILGVMTGGIGFAGFVFVILGVIKYAGTLPDLKWKCPDCGSENVRLQFEGYIDENNPKKSSDKKQWYGEFKSPSKFV